EPRARDEEAEQHQRQQHSHDQRLGQELPDQDAPPPRAHREVANAAGRHLPAELVVAEQRDEEREEDEGGAEHERHQQRELREVMQGRAVLAHQEPEDPGGGCRGGLGSLRVKAPGEETHHQADERGAGAEEEEEHQHPGVPEDPEQLGPGHRQRLEEGAQRGLRAYQRRPAEVFTVSESPSYHGGTCALRSPSRSSPCCSPASPPRTRRSIPPRSPEPSSRYRTSSPSPLPSRPRRSPCPAG